MAEERPARGSDDDYCSAYFEEPHAYVSHSVDAPPIRWVKRCSLCGHISSKALREELARAALAEINHELVRLRLLIGELTARFASRSETEAGESKDV